MKGIKQSQSPEHRVDSCIPNLTQFSSKQLHYHIMTMSLLRENEKEFIKTQPQPNNLCSADCVQIIYNEMIEWVLYFVAIL